MKRTVLLVFTALLLSNLGWSQIQEEDRSMSEGINPAFVLTIPNASKKLVTKTWKKYLKEHDIKLKKDRKSDEGFAIDVVIPSISSNTLKFYSRLELESEGGVSIIWLKDGENFISGSSHAEEAKSAEIFMMKFALKLTIEMTKAELSKEEKELKKLNKTRDKLVSKKKSLEKTIKKAEKTIKNAEADIVTNGQEQEQIKEEIGKQDGVVKEVKKKLADLEIDY